MKQLSISFLLIVLFLGSFSCKKEDLIIPKKQATPNIKKSPSSTSVDDFVKSFNEHEIKWNIYYD